MKKFVILTAWLSAVISLSYAVWQKRTMNSRLLDSELKTMLKYRRNSTQNIFPHPTENDLNIFTGNSCRNIAYQLAIDSYSDSDYGNLSRECAVLILNELAKNVPEGESLSEYFAGKMQK